MGDGGERRGCIVGVWKGIDKGEDMDSCGYSLHGWEFAGP
jgi:hypothetical protein